MYLFLCSNDCVTIHPANVWHDFTVTLPQPLDLLRDEDWHVALTQVWIENRKAIKDKVLYIFSDICEESFINGTTLQVLASNYNHDSQEAPAYVRIVHRTVPSIRITVKGASLQTPVTTGNNIRLYCTLHLTRRCPPDHI